MAPSPQVLGTVSVSVTANTIHTVIELRDNDKWRIVLSRVMVLIADRAGNHSEPGHRCTIMRVVWEELAFSNASKLSFSVLSLQVSVGPVLISSS